MGNVLDTSRLAGFPLSFFRSFTKFQLPVLASITSLGPFAIDAYLPAFPVIAESLAIDPVLMAQTVSAYFIGLSAGGLLAGPISDQIGRRPVALFGLVVFAVACLLMPLAASLEQMLLIRVLQAIGGGFSTAVVLPTIRDVSPVELFASRAGLVYSLLLIAPMLAPIAGAALLTISWHWIFIAMGCYTLIVLVLYIAGIPESNESRAGRFRIKPVFAAYWRVATHRLGVELSPMRYGVAYGIAFGIFFTYLSNVSFIFQTYFGVSPTIFTLLFVINVGFMGVIQISSSRYLRGKNLHVIAGLMRFGFVAQLVALIATLILVLAVEPPLWVFVIFLMVSMGMFGMIVPSSVGVYLAPFRHSSGTATAITTTLGFLLGSALGSLSGLLNQGNLLACLGIMVVASVIANLILFSISRAAERSALDALQDGREQTI